MLAKHLVGISSLYYEVSIQLRRQFLRPDRLEKTLFMHTIMSGQVDASIERGQEADDKEEKDKIKKSQQGMSFADAHNLKRANLQLAKDSSPISTTVVHPGLSPESVGHYGHPSLSSILKIASSARIYAMHMPQDNEGRTFFEYDKLTDGYYTFVSSTQVDILPGMYDSSVPKWPLEIKLQGGHIGRTSLSTVSSMTSPADPNRQTLMTQINQVVLVDKETRRPTPIQDHWRDKYQGHCLRGEPLIIKRQEAPESDPLSVYEVKVAWSDTDFYNHTNFASYPRFALDAVHDALRLGKLEGHLSAADMAAGIRQVKVAYMGESTEGEVLKIKLWKGEDKDRCLVCSIEKEGQLINQVTLVFYAP